MTTTTAAAGTDGGERTPKERAEIGNWEKNGGFAADVIEEGQPYAGNQASRLDPCQDRFKGAHNLP